MVKSWIKNNFRNTFALGKKLSTWFYWSIKNLKPIFILDRRYVDHITFHWRNFEEIIVIRRQRITWPLRNRQSHTQRMSTAPKPGNIILQWVSNPLFALYVAAELLDENVFYFHRIWKFFFNIIRITQCVSWRVTEFHFKEIVKQISSRRIRVTEDGLKEVGKWICIYVIFYRPHTFNVVVP